MKRSKTVVWRQTSSQTTSYLNDVISWNLIIASSLVMLAEVFPELRIVDKYAFTLEILGIAILALYRVSFSCLIVPVITAIVGIHLYVVNSIMVEDAFLYPLHIYGQKYSEHFGQNISLGSGHSEYLGYVLIASCIIAIVIFETITKLTGRKIFRFVLPAAIIMATAYVGALPQWPGLAILLLSIVFVKSNFDYIASTFVALIMLISPLIFAHPVDKMAEKMPEMVEIQKIVEEQLAGNLVSSFFASSVGTIDNSSPQVTGRELLVFSADKSLSGNMYLPEFQGARYKNGVWEADTEFDRVCKEGGLDPDKMRKTLVQGPRMQAIELSKACNKELEETSDYQNAYLQQLKYIMPSEIKSKIKYTGLMNDAAIVPYGSNFDKLNSVSLEKNTITKKSRWMRSLSMETFSVSDDCQWNISSSYKYKANFETGDVDEDSDAEQYWTVYDDSDEDKTFYIEDGYMLDELRTSANNINSNAQKNAIRGHEKEWNWYNAYAREYYTSLPKGAEEYLNEFTEKIAQKEEMSPEELNQEIAEELQKSGRQAIADKLVQSVQENCYYSWNLEEVPEGVDVIDFFLNSEHKGYCKHFAAAATLLCRRYGIPARYVTGYVVKQRKNLEDSKGRVNIPVTDRNAHAWVEIYLDNIGWIPVEATPGYNDPNGSLPTDSASIKAREEREQKLYKRADDKVKQDYNNRHSNDDDADNSSGDMKAQQDSQQNSQEDSQQDSQEDSQEDSQKDSQQDIQKDSGKITGAPGNNGGSPGKESTGNKKSSKNIIILINILVLVLSALILGFLLKFNNDMQKAGISERMAKKRYRAVVKQVNRKLYRRMRRKHKIPLSHITDREYEELLIKTYPDIEEADWARYMNIAKKVAFSQENISQEEADFSYKLYLSLR